MCGSESAFFFLTKINCRMNKEHMYSADFSRLQRIRQERSPLAVGQNRAMGYKPMVLYFRPKRCCGSHCTSSRL